MNERIKQLADQALKECDAAKERGIDQYSKRFAELIVRECMTNLYIKGHDDAVIQLREEFGVEL
jgi:hypothetical protein